MPLVRGIYPKYTESGAIGLVSCGNSRENVGEYVETGRFHPTEAAREGQWRNPAGFPEGAFSLWYLQKRLAPGVQAFLINSFVHVRQPDG